MGNNVNGVNLAQLAQESLELLQPTLVDLKIFTTDFSAAVAQEGESVSTRIPSAVTGVDNIETLGWAGSAEEVQTSERKVTLGNLEGFVVGFTDTEWSKSSINLHRLFLRPGVHSVAKRMQDKVFNLFTAANFANVANVTEANFDSDDVADIAKQATGLYWPARDRALILKPSYFTALTKDPAVKAAYAYGNSSVIQQRKIPGLAGFDPIVEAAGFPATAGLPDGVAVLPQAVCIAARVPAIPSEFPGDIETVTDPDSGFTLQLRRWYSADLGKYFLGMAFLGGAVKGDGTAAIRIVGAKAKGA